MNNPWTHLINTQYIAVPKHHTLPHKDGQLLFVKNSQEECVIHFSLPSSKNSTKLSL